LIKEFFSEAMKMTGEDVDTEIKKILQNHYGRSGARKRTKDTDNFLVTVGGITP
jgi:hypothetical protein